MVAHSIFAAVPQVHRIAQAVDTFYDRYGALPGDLPNAGKILPGCPGVNGSDCDPFPASAGDGIIGNKNFSQSLKPQAARAHIPATSAADETTLFWAHLYYAGLLDVEDLALFEDRPPSSLKSKMAGRLVVGYADGSPFPSRLTPEGKPYEGDRNEPPPKGLLLVMVSDAALNGTAEMNEAGKQPLSGRLARTLDSGKMDNSHPKSGWIQAYGAPNCFVQEKGVAHYNETSPEYDCGAIFWFSKERDDRLRWIFHHEPVKKSKKAK